MPRIVAASAERRFIGELSARPQRDTCTVNPGWRGCAADPTGLFSVAPHGLSEKCCAVRRTKLPTHRSPLVVVPPCSLRPTNQLARNHDPTVIPDYSPGALLDSVTEPMTVRQNDFLGGLRRPPPFPQELLYRDGCEKNVRRCSRHSRWTSSRWACAGGGIQLRGCGPVRVG